MARFTISLSFDATDEAEATAHHSRLREYIRTGSSFHVVSSRLDRVADVPDPVDAHGKHGVADGDGSQPSDYDSYRNRLVELGMVTPGLVAPHQPEKRPATCACDIGAGAQPYAHEPSCPVHPRYVDTGLSDADRTPKDVPASHMDHAEPDGEEAVLKDQYARTLALAKTGPLDVRTLSRLLKLAQRLGLSILDLRIDFSMV